MFKQDLATMYDCNYDDLYHELDDCNFGFVDTSALKRYLLKCSIYASDVLLIALMPDSAARNSLMELRHLKITPKEVLVYLKKVLRDQSQLLADLLS
jgi:cellulose biosynthesis protein BcsQ